MNIFGNNSHPLSQQLTVTICQSD